MLGATFDNVAVIGAEAVVTGGIVLCHNGVVQK